DHTSLPPSMNTPLDVRGNSGLSRRLLRRRRVRPRETTYNCVYREGRAERVEQHMAKRHELELAQASLVLCERNIKQGESFVRAQRKLVAEIKENVARLQKGIVDAEQAKS